MKCLARTLIICEKPDAARRLANALTESRPESHRKYGLTLIEIIIVLIIISVIGVLTIPNIAKMREKTEKKACLGNLWILKMAKDQWALDENKITGDSVSWSDIIPAYLDQTPVCPSTNTSSYYLNLIGQNPTCTQTDHEL